VAWCRFRTTTAVVRPPARRTPWYGAALLGLILCGVVCVRQEVQGKKNPTLHCGDWTVVLTVTVSGRPSFHQQAWPGLKSLGTKKTNNSFFSAANETLTTKCYYSLMDNDMESLSLYYQYHRWELHILNKSKTANISFPPKFFIGGTWHHGP
jgi:hypothetical protein